MPAAANSDILFQQIRIGPVTAPNRFYAVPHATGHGIGQPNGAYALRATKAEGGWGTVAVQITEVSPDSDMANHPIERIWDDTYIAGHAHQVEAIKAHGALAAIELGHGGMRARNFTTGLPVPGPSNLPLLRPEIPAQARAMDLSDIRAFRHAHKQAAKRAKQAGYDILYVYAAHDISLLSNFLSLRTNFRSDCYGGSLENRARLLREVLEDTLEIADGTNAVALRFSVQELGVAQGLAADGEGRDVVEMLADLPDLWDVNVSGWPYDSQSSRFSDEGFQLGYTSFVKQVTRKPVVGVGRFTSPETMRRVVRDGLLDLIGCARPSIADPFLPEKIRSGREDEIRECIGCNVCVSMDSYGVPLRCSQNPTIAEEWRRGWHPERVAAAKSPGRNLIIGAGPAALECALTLMRGGHHVTLAEAGNAAGGRALSESQLAGLSAWHRIVDYRMNLLIKSNAVDLFLQSPMTAADVQEFPADNVILATGATWRRDGVGSTNFTPRDLSAPGFVVLTPDDILSGAKPDNRVVIYDDEHNYMASVIAEDLARKGASVTYVTPMATLAPWTENTLEQKQIIARLTELGCAILVNQTLLATTTGRVSFTTTTLACDTLVFVGARSPNTTLWDEISTGAPQRPLYRIGDCDVPGTLQAAVLSGHRIAREILAGARSEMKLDRPLIEF